jgi:HAD superfamily hydrolase (TIGR01509 family)
LSDGRSHGSIRDIFDGATGAIFDLNGVLVEDEPLHEAAFTTALAPYGISLTHEVYQRAVLGQSDMNAASRLAAIYDRRLPIAEIVQAKERLYRERLRAEGSSYVVAAARPLVEALAARGLRLALASASPAIEVYTWLDLLGLRHHFDTVLVSESPVGTKPNPAVYEAIRDAWGTTADACVVLDDHQENIAIAHTLGMRTVAVASTLPPATFTHAQVVVHTLAELYGWTAS